MKVFKNVWKTQPSGMTRNNFRPKPFSHFENVKILDYHYIVWQVSYLGVQQRDSVEAELSGRRQETIAKLWNITETLNVLYRENWTLMANVEMIKFQNEMIQSIKQEMRPGGTETGGSESCNHSKETIWTDRLY